MLIHGSVWDEANKYAQKLATDPGMDIIWYILLFFSATNTSTTTIRNVELKSIRKI